MQAVELTSALNAVPFYHLYMMAEAAAAKPLLLAAALLRHCLT